MAAVKCVKCKKLIREVLNVNGKDVVVYTCPRFPYMAALSGLFRPGKGVEKAAQECQELVNECVVCGTTENLIHYHLDIPICADHDHAWGDWLHQNPEKQKYFHPKKMTRTDRWFEVFREFVESQRKCHVCGCTWENACVTPEGTCSWVDWNLCSTCEGKEIKQ